MSLRRSARIKERVDAVAVSTGSSLTTAINTDKSWCSCGGYDDGRLILCCDRQMVGCCVWYHYDCVGLSISDGLQLGASENGFVCPHCSTTKSNTTDNYVHTASAVDDCLFTPDVDFQWGDITGRQFCDLK